MRKNWTNMLSRTSLTNFIKIFTDFLSNISHTLQCISEWKAFDFRFEYVTVFCLPKQILSLQLTTHIIPAWHFVWLYDAFGKTHSKGKKDKAFIFSRKSVFILVQSEHFYCTDYQHRQISKFSLKFWFLSLSS